MTTQNFQQFLFSEKHSRKSLKFIFTFLNTIDEHLWTGWATLAINGVTNKFICRREKREREGVKDYHIKSIQFDLVLKMQYTKELC